MTSPTSGSSPSPETSPQPVPSPELEKTAAAVADSGGQVDAPKLELRQAVITAVNLAAATCSVAIGGDSTSVPNVHYLSNYKPTTGDTCWILVNGPDLLALDRDGKFGAAAWAGMGVDYIDTQESRASGSYGNLATTGPAVSSVIPASGRLLVCVSADVTTPYVPGYEDAWMSFAISGAYTLSALDQNALMVVTNVSWGHTHTFSDSGSVSGSCSGSTSGGQSFSGSISGSSFGSGVTASNSSMPAQSEMMASRVVLLTGLTPGSITVTAKYRTSGSTGYFKRRQIWVLPL